jgi:hypothetical protein
MTIRFPIASFPMISLLTTASTITCPHGGSLSLSTANAVAKAEGAPILLETDVHTVSGCPFQKPAAPSPIPSPCVTVRWSAGATQTKINGIGALLQTSVGLCSSAEQLPQGTAIVAQTQSSAKGS